MGNVLSKLKKLCCENCKTLRCCCKDRCLTEEERIQIIYDQISSQEIWDTQV